MKKFGFNSPSGNRYAVLKKGLIVMKITLVLILISTFNLLATISYSQTARVSLNLNQVSVKQALKNIEQSSEFYFLYNNELVDVERKVDIHADNEQIGEILDQIFANQDTKYAVYDRQIVISPANMSLPQEAQRKISGKVTDSSGTTLPGVSVVVKGTTLGIITDSDGKFTLLIPSEAKTLVFSFVGMKTKEIPIGNKSEFTIALSEETINLEEVVAVGYGTQKKINLTGSISSVSTQDFLNRPESSVINALEGKMPGVTVRTTGGGQPGADIGTINVRGIGTGLGGSPASTSPMVIVDGTVASMGEVNSDDIESISVLKDAASAAIYGARASNGVILVTTKKGKKGHVQISYDVYGGLQSINRKPDFLPSWQQASLYNEALANEGSSLRWSDNDIQLFKNGTDVTGAHPNTDWLKLLYSRPGYQQSHVLNISGGDDKTQYMFSIGYFDQQGNVAKTDQQKYNSRFNLNTRINKYFAVDVSLSYLYAPFTQPVSTYATSFSQILRQANRISNTVPYKWGNGAYGYVADGSPMAWLNSPSIDQIQSNTLTGNLGLNWSPVQGLHVKPSFAYRSGISNTQQYVSDIYYYSGGPIGTPLVQTKYQGPNNLTDSNTTGMYTMLQVLADYEKSIHNNNFKLLVGASQEYSKSSYFSAYRMGFLNNAISQLNAAPATGQSVTGTASVWTLQSLFGRLNYNYAEKYLFEANLRYDGSSRFAEGKKWGAFPSLSAGWLISKEDFFQSISNSVNSLKLRASWGRLGNQQISNYPTYSIVSPGQTYSFNQTLMSGLAPTTGANSDIQWETTEISGAGIDAAFLSNKLSVSLDYFNKMTNNILMVLPVAAPYSLSAPYQNAGAMTNKGIELSLGYKDKIGKVNINVSGNMSYIKNEVTDLKGTGPYISGDTYYNVGTPFYSLYGYKCLGIYQNANQVKGSAVLNSTVGPGDLIYQDVNHDGVIDDKDKVNLGTYFPKVTYGFTASANWKNFDITLFFQGDAGVKADGGNLIGQVGPDVQKPTSVFLNAWTPTNPSTTFPRLWYRHSQNDPATNPSSFWIKDASYLRLKNLMVSYNLPKRFTSKIHATNIKVFFSGQNMLTFTKFYKWIDPEQGASASIYNYPQVMVNSIGLNLTF